MANLTGHGSCRLLHTVSGGLPLTSCSLKGGVGSCGSWNSTLLPPGFTQGILGPITVPRTGGIGAAHLTIFTMDMQKPGAVFPPVCINGCVNSSGWLRIMRSTSVDGGRRWTQQQKPVWTHQFVDKGTPPGAPFIAVLPSQILELRSGRLLFIFEVNTAATESGFQGAGGSFLQNMNSLMYTLSSLDGGDSWESLANLDGPPYIKTPPTGVDASPVLWIAEGRGEFGSEIAATELSNGNVVAFIRPHYSPYMIEALSKSEGAEWIPLSKGHFVMYACGSAAVTTTSGAVLVGGRFPGQGVQVSWDNGKTFRTYTIDSTGHGQGSMIEAAPNVVLFVYGEQSLHVPSAEAAPRFAPESYTVVDIAVTVVAGGPHLRQQYIRVSADPQELTPLSPAEAHELLAQYHSPPPHQPTAILQQPMATKETWASLSNDGWQFVGGDWSVSSSANGSSLVAPNNNQQNFAFHSQRQFIARTNSEVLLTATFEFQWQYFFTTAGFIFGAKNSSSFLQLDFPHEDPKNSILHFCWLLDWLLVAGCCIGCWLLGWYA